MFPGALQIFQNALQSGDQESAKKFIRDLNIAWASKSVEVDLATLSKDNLSTSLVPEDIYSQPQAGIPVALQATGNGNCLYNSASLILCGNEQRSHYLRVLVAEELYGSLDGTLKRGGVRTSSFQSSKEEAIELCLTGLTERFGNLLSCEAETSQPSSYSVTEVINDLLVFNVDAWPNNVKDLVAFGNDKIERLTNWFRMLIEKAGCNVALIPEEWLSLNKITNVGRLVRTISFGSGLERTIWPLVHAWLLERFVQVSL